MGRNGKTGRVIRNQERKARKASRPTTVGEARGWVSMSGAMGIDRSAYDAAVYNSLRQNLYFDGVVEPAFVPGTPRPRFSLVPKAS